MSSTLGYAAVLLVALDCLARTTGATSDVCVVGAGVGSPGCSQTKLDISSDDDVLTVLGGNWGKSLLQLAQPQRLERMEAPTERGPKPRRRALIENGAWANKTERHSQSMTSARASGRTVGSALMSEPLRLAEKLGNV